MPSLVNTDDLKYRAFLGGDEVFPGVAFGDPLRDANTGEILYSEQHANTPKEIDLACQNAREEFLSGKWNCAFMKAQKAAVFRKASETLESLQERIARVDAIQSGVVISVTREIAKFLQGVLEEAAMKIEGGFPEARESEVTGDEEDQGTSPVSSGEEKDSSPSSAAKEAEKTKTKKKIISQPHPRGVTVVLAPWNAPAGSALPKIAGALVCGCPVILKPSPWAPFSLQLVVKSLLDAGLPPGMLQLLHGGPQEGQMMVSNPAVSVVVLTGGREAAMSVRQSVVTRPVCCLIESGGSNSLIVCRDADIDVAVGGALAGLTLLNGQWCAGASRLLVHEAVYAEFEAKLRKALREMRLGSSMNPQTDMGPLGNACILDGLKNLVGSTKERFPEAEDINEGETEVSGLSGATAQAGAEAPIFPRGEEKEQKEKEGPKDGPALSVCGSVKAPPSTLSERVRAFHLHLDHHLHGLFDAARHRRQKSHGESPQADTPQSCDSELRDVGAGEGALFFRPAVLKGLPLEVFAQREVFGPVASLHKWGGDSEGEIEEENKVVQAVNGVDAALQHYVFTQSSETSRRIARKLRCGLVQVNMAAPGFPAESPPRWSYFGLAGCGEEGNFEETASQFLLWQTLGPC
uniref:Aldehyde dehydrogenase domain-containing protein n=1 Tax=Chromera velia CCMP2878 TaxID=1169474 RepID=A0A0G4FA35_9ALVE|eukprot:Cvel_15985.t1-p1 / transcript=Cvel_15985.t1 / gene=Cvel_15985 / organism=Chromera_velia_CCMP2878 / gene_product=Betaine aldehyde dehydrogenase, putative / transcript_product=Betaine aldehyde dehydrogenase, putative / location=Cvel_scaffold1210:42575-48045(+) / protein_length=633 / sequence_SO=supercontig / SO=protein_coding / is_pseudo=false